MVNECIGMNCNKKATHYVELYGYKSLYCEECAEYFKDDRDFKITKLKHKEDDNNATCSGRKI